MSTARKLSVAALILVAAVVGVATWWLAGSADEAVDQEHAEELASELSSTDDQTTPVAETPEPVTDVNGTWNVTAQNVDAVSDGSFAGYRINEILSGVDNEVTGRTSQVTGQITIEGDQLTAGSFEVDMASIATDQGQRDKQMRDRGYQYAQFPTSRFVVTEPVAIDTNAALRGEAQQVAVIGELTLHGVSREVTLEVTASLVGSTLAVTGSIDIALADHDIEKPTGMRAGDVDDVGVMEFQLFFAKA